jgi:hypothetical protein
MFAGFRPYLICGLSAGEALPVSGTGGFQRFNWFKDKSAF